MKKILLLPLMMILASATIVPGAKKEAINVKAEGATNNDVTNVTKSVTKGFITNNLVNSETKVVNLKDDTLTKFNNNFSTVAIKPTTYDDGVFKNAYQKYNALGAKSEIKVNDGNDETLSYTYYASNDDYNNTQWGLTTRVVTKSSTSGVSDITERFFNTRYGFDYCMEDWNKEEEQPLELAIPLNLEEIETGIKNCFPFIKASNAASRPSAAAFSVEFPIISINGYDYFTAKFSYTLRRGGSYTITYSSSNSRAYIGYNESDKASYVFLEIPFTNYLETINIATYVKTIGRMKISWPKRNRNIYLLNNAKNSGFNAPLIVTDLNFKDGTVTALTSNSVYLDSNNNATIDATDGKEYIRLDSIVIDDTYTLYTKAKEYETERQVTYELYTDSNYTIKFTYDSDNELAKKLQDLKDDEQVKITKYNYSILKKENLSSTEYATTSDFVDCGTYYGFKKINKDQIHTVTFNSIASNNGIYSRVAFNAYDSVLNTNLSKINALMFQYSFNGTLYNLSISGEDISQGVPGGSVWFPGLWQFIFKTSGHGDLTTDLNRTLSKTDENGIKFSFHGMKDTDYISFDWTGNEELKASKQSNMFILYCRNGAVKFNSLVSCVYVDKAGDLINCSSIFPNGVEAPTAIIGDDGKVTIVDVNGNTIKGTVNEKGFFVDDKDTPWEYPSNVPDPTNPWDKILKPLKQIASIVCTVAIVAGVIWCISKLGPTIVAIFKKKE